MLEFERIRIPTLFKGVKDSINLVELRTLLKYSRVKDSIKML